MYCDMFFIPAEYSYVVRAFYMYLYTVKLCFGDYFWQTVVFCFLLFLPTYKINIQVSKTFADKILSMSKFCSSNTVWIHFICVDVLVIISKFYCIYKYIISGSVL